MRGKSPSGSPTLPFGLASRFWWVCKAKRSDGGRWCRISNRDRPEVDVDVRSIRQSVCGRRTQALEISPGFHLLGKPNGVVDKLRRTQSPTAGCSVNGSNSSGMIVSQRCPKQVIDETSILAKPSDSSSTLPLHFSPASVRFFSKIRANFDDGKKK